MTGQHSDQEMSTLDRRRLRYAEIADEYEGAEHDAELVGLDDRYALVEENMRGSSPPYWVTPHKSPGDASGYHHGQEYAEDWRIVVLIDLETGEHLEPQWTTTVFGPGTPQATGTVGT